MNTSQRVTRDRTLCNHQNGGQVAVIINALPVQPHFGVIEIVHVDGAPRSQHLHLELLQGVVDYASGHVTYRASIMPYLGRLHTCSYSILLNLASLFGDMLRQSRCSTVDRKAEEFPWYIMRKHDYMPVLRSIHWAVDHH